MLLCILLVEKPTVIRIIDIICLGIHNEITLNIAAMLLDVGKQFHCITFCWPMCVCFLL